jgi:hypothetical protein
MMSVESAFLRTYDVQSRIVDTQLAVMNNPNISPMQREQARETLLAEMDKLQAIINEWMLRQ